VTAVRIGGSPRVKWVYFGLAALLLLALAVRITIERPTLIAERQYRSMLIARGYFLRGEPDVPEWRRAAAEAAVAGAGVLEPPIFEELVIVLFRIAVRFAAPGVALMVAGYYLFLPLGIEVSTIFLPEPLMMAAYLLSLLLILRHHEAPAPKRLLAAALVSGAAVLIKPLCLFAIIGAFAGLWLCRARRERSVEYGSALAFLSITLTVGAAYYVYGLFLSDLMADKAGSSFFPHLLLTGEFWSQWPRTALEAFGVVPVILALLGLPALSRNVPRGLVFGVLASYPVFLATFAYHVRFADYYHLQMIPAVALAATPVLTRAVRYARSTFSRREAVPLLLLALAVAWWGVFTELESRQAGRTAIESRKVAREIGELVGHSVRVVFVSPYYGNPLSYHAEVAGDFWRRANRPD
jgi:hypothetical protein